MKKIKKLNRGEVRSLVKEAMSPLPGKPLNSLVSEAQPDDSHKWDGPKDVHGHEGRSRSRGG